MCFSPQADVGGGVLNRRDAVRGDGPRPGRGKLAPYHLSYGIRVSDGLMIVALYVVAVCGPLLVSGYRSVALFGVVNLVALIVIARLTISRFASVW